MSDAAQKNNTPTLLAQLDAAVTAGLPALVALWQARDPVEWQRDPEVFRRLGTRALKQGGAIFAHDVVTEGLRHWRRTCACASCKHWRCRAAAHACARPSC